MIHFIKAKINVYLIKLSSVQFIHVEAFLTMARYYKELRTLRYVKLFILIYQVSFTQKYNHKVKALPSQS